MTANDTAGGMLATALRLEIAVSSPAGAAVALQGGADRAELCSALELGGVTPSQALVELSAATGLPIHVLVRCRPGDFVYDADEAALMEREVRTALTAGAEGVVIGATTADGTLDKSLLRRLSDAARDVKPSAEITLHRAIDHAADPVAAFADAGALGFTRVLTSGGAASAAQGIGTIEAMVRTGSPVQVMAGAGVSPATIPALAAAGVDAVHLSAKRAVAPAGHGGVSMGSADTGAGHFTTDPDVVAAARAAVDLGREHRTASAHR